MRRDGRIRDVPADDGYPPLLPRFSPSEMPAAAPTWGALFMYHFHKMH
ncbi:hypothetical protein BTRA_1012 [Burkholderia thailandensis USAMRU Malaysia |nr:hypothetical protein BTQ_2820 [Burkholderia thailandensis 2002721723]AHI79303.1 hypothetical protein BTJ_2875 [Burkholderia thailandensis E444]AIC87007.1 hypothetical protein BTRA_1012 [Burkholderia thailandensis USAMRU Malaysia \